MSLGGGNWVRCVSHDREPIQMKKRAEDHLARYSCGCVVEDFVVLEATLIIQNLEASSRILRSNNQKTLLNDQTILTNKHRRKFRHRKTIVGVAYSSS